MTNIEKLEKNCIADLNSILRKYLRGWYVGSLALNYISITTDVGYIDIQINSGVVIKIDTNEKIFKPRNIKYIDFYSGVHVYLTNMNFHSEIIKRFRKYQKAGNKMIKIKTYNKEYA